MLGVGVLFGAFPARAQVLPEGEAAHSSFELTLRAEERRGIRIELYDPKERPPRHLPAAVCFDRCEVHALPGRYLLRVSGPPGSGVRTSKRYLDLEGASVVTIDPPSIAGRYVGLGLGIAGIMAISIGAAMLVTAPETPSGERWLLPGGITLASGLVATPVGWVMFGTNGKPSVDVRRPAPR